MDKNQVLPGFISVDEAVDLINKHTATNPRVDLPRMMRGYYYILKGNNFNIFLRQAVNGRGVDMGIRPVMLRDSYDVERLKKALRDKFEEIAGREYDEARIRSVARSSTITDDNMSGKPRKTRSMAQVGQDVTTSRSLSHNDFKDSAADAAVLDTVLGD